MYCSIVDQSVKLHATFMLMTENSFLVFSRTIYNDLSADRNEIDNYLLISVTGTHVELKLSFCVFYYGVQGNE